MRSVWGECSEFPTPAESIEEIYLIDWETPNYVKFANMAEEVLKDDYYCLSEKQRKAYKEYNFKAKLVRTFVNMPWLYDRYLSMIKNPDTKFPLIAKQRKVREAAHEVCREMQAQHEHELTGNEEIKNIIARIKNAVESGN